MAQDDFGIYNFNFKTNMSAAMDLCAEHHKNATLPYYRCMCSGVTSESFHYRRYKYYFCKRASDLEKEESGKQMAEVGETVGIVLGVCVLLFLLIFIYRKFKVQIKRGLSSAFSNMGMRQHYEACTRMFCVCCQNPSKSQHDELPPNQNLSGRPSDRCGSFCYSDTFLGIMEFFCDCDCFRTRRAPKFMIPIVGKAKPKPQYGLASDGGEFGSDADLEEPVELQQPRRMRSVRKAPPPPSGPSAAAAAAAAAAATAPSLPDAPAFDPEKRSFGTGKRPAPGPPTVEHDYRPAPQAYSAPPPQYSQLHFQQAPPPPPPLQRATPLRVSNEFTSQLNQAMAGRRWPSESEI